MPIDLLKPLRQLGQAEQPTGVQDQTAIDAEEERKRKEEEERQRKIAEAQAELAAAKTQEEAQAIFGGYPDIADALKLPVFPEVKPPEPVTPPAPEVAPPVIPPQPEVSQLARQTGFNEERQVQDEVFKQWQMDNPDKVNVAGIRWPSHDYPISSNWSFDNKEPFILKLDDGRIIKAGNADEYRALLQNIITNEGVEFDYSTGNYQAQPGTYEYIKTMESQGKTDYARKALFDNVNVNIDYQDYLAYTEGSMTIDEIAAKYPNLGQARPITTTVPREMTYQQFLGREETIKSFDTPARRELNTALRLQEKTYAHMLYVQDIYRAKGEPPPAIPENWQTMTGISEFAIEEKDIPADFKQRVSQSQWAFGMNSNPKAMQEMVDRARKAVDAEQKNYLPPGWQDTVTIDTFNPQGYGITITTPSGWTRYPDNTYKDVQGKTYTSQQILENPTLVDSYASVFDEADIADLKKWATTDYGKFTNLLTRVGDTPETRAMLKRLYPDLTDKEVKAFYQAVKPSIESVTLASMGAGVSARGAAYGAVLPAIGEAFNWYIENVNLPLAQSFMFIKTKELLSPEKQTEYEILEEENAKPGADWQTNQARMKELRKEAWDLRKVAEEAEPSKYQIGGEVPLYSTKDMLAYLRGEKTAEEIPILGKMDISLLTATEVAEFAADPIWLIGGFGTGSAKVLSRTTLKILAKEGEEATVKFLMEKTLPATGKKFTELEARTVVRGMQLKSAELAMQKGVVPEAAKAAEVVAPKAPEIVPTAKGITPKIIKQEVTPGNFISKIEDEAGNLRGSLKYTENPDNIRIDMIEVPPEMQGQGNARQLVLDLIQESQIKNKPLLSGGVTGQGLKLFESLANKGDIKLLTTEEGRLLGATGEPTTQTFKESSRYVIEAGAPKAEQVAPKVGGIVPPVRGVEQAVVKSEIQVRKETARKAVQDAWDAKKQTGIVSDAKAEAEKDLRLFNALVDLAKVHIDDGVKTIAEFAKAAGIEINAAVRAAWKAAQSGEAASLEGLSVNARKSIGNVKMIAQRQFNTEERAAVDNLIATSKKFDDIWEATTAERQAQLSKKTARLEEAQQSFQGAERIAEENKARAGLLTDIGLTEKQMAITPENAKALEDMIYKSPELDTWEKANASRAMRELVNDWRMPRPFEREYFKKVFGYDVANLFKQSDKPRLGDYVTEVLYNSFISLKSNVVNFGGNTIAAVFSPVERLGAAIVEAPLAAIGKRPRQRFIGEAVQDLVGVWTGIPDGVRSWLEVMKSGQISGSALKGEVIRPRAFKGKLGRVINFNTDLMYAFDELFKSVNRSAAMRAEAYRTASKEGLKGNAFLERLNVLINDPPEELVKSANKLSEYRLFRAQSDFADKIIKLRDLEVFGEMGRGVKPIQLVVPFVKTPINLSKFGIERSPIAIFNPKLYNNLIKNNPEAADLLARWGIGSLIALSVVIYAKDGLVTGGLPKNSAERDEFYRLGKQPYSLKIGNKWISYQRLEPFNMMFLQGANIVEAFNSKDKDLGKIAGHFAAGIGESIANQNFLAGVSDTLNAIVEPERYGGGYFQRMLANLQPGSSTSRLIAQMLDPTIRAPQNLVEQIKSNIPVLSRTVSAKVNLFGEPQKRETPAIMPYVWATEKDDKITKVLIAAGVTPGFPGKTITDKGKPYKLNDREYYDYQVLVGELIKKELIAKIGNRASVPADTLESAIDTARASGKKKYLRILREAGRKPDAD